MRSFHAYALAEFTWFPTCHIMVVQRLLFIIYHRYVQSFLTTFGILNLSSYCTINSFTLYTPLYRLFRDTVRSITVPHRIQRSRWRRNNRYDLHKLTLCFLSLCFLGDFWWVFLSRESEFTLFLFPFLVLYSDSTHQLLGKYLLFKGLTVSNVEVVKSYVTPCVVYES